MGRRRGTYRRGIATVVGAVIAVAAMIALALVITQAFDERMQLAEERLERAREDLAVIPVVNSTGVYAEIINRGYIDTLIKYIIVINRSNGQIIYNAAPSTHLDPGNTTLVKLGDWSHGRLDIAVVTQRGSVFRWDPELTLDGVLDLPGEPSGAGAGAGGYYGWVLGHPSLAFCDISSVDVIRVNVTTPPGTVASARVQLQASTYILFVSISGITDTVTWRLGDQWPSRFPEAELLTDLGGLVAGLYAKVDYSSGDFIATAEAALLLNLTNLTQPIVVVSDALYSPIPPDGSNGLGYMYIIEPPGGLAPIASSRGEARLPLTDLLGSLSEVVASASPPSRGEAVVLRLDC